MAEIEQSQPTDAKEVWVKPAITFFKAIGMLFDVATLMVRLLVNTLMYDSPLGKPDSGDERSTLARS